MAARVLQEAAGIVKGDGFHVAIVLGEMRRAASDRRHDGSRAPITSGALECATLDGLADIGPDLAARVPQQTWRAPFERCRSAAQRENSKACGLPELKHKGD